MNIVFMGTPSYARVILESLIKSHNIKALICQTDKKAGRNMKLVMPDTKQFILEYNEKNNTQVEILQPESFDASVIEQIRSFRADVIVVAAFGKILPKEVLEIAPCINLHASILPQYRGASPIQSAILNGDSNFGVTAMLMEEGLDCGDMLGFSVINNNGQNSDELFCELSSLAAKLLLQVLKRLDSIKPLKQESCMASYCSKIKKEFGEVSFLNLNSLILERKFLAYSSWPKVFLESGLRLVRLKACEVSSNNKMGEILQISKEGVVVACKEGSVLITCVQAPSKKEISAYEYVQGKRMKVGDIFL
ncbi:MULTISPECIES: methionyl-tRNA formyltransferase [Helicobacter]|uniref:Methionyl-tRNA formyltransferase n=1 Tax=Helicobacter ibis TaxID=2962633 RepID=A0ABT4VD35_9HELI|nr:MULTISPECIES: methionyl-tRNA formyltransferase [Helicobacter]MDA3967322.1 methionyl-tRNA formyltransferase [Helicobacter sp. WB40]MDA3968609.1 methionyl-tRNA formyltransferase [Helicobacter ibis]